MSEDPRNGSPNDPRNRTLGVEAQHIFASEINSAENAEDARRLLNSIRLGIDLNLIGPARFNLESRGNKIILLARPNVRDAILNAPDPVQQVLVDAGFGWNTQNSEVNSPGGPARPNEVNPAYNAFTIKALNRLAIEAGENDWSQQAKERAVFDLLRQLPAQAMDIFA